MYFHKNFLSGKIIIVFFSSFLLAIAIVETGLSTSEIFAQTNNQSQGQQSEGGIGSIEELEKLTAPSNDTSNNTSLMGGLEKSQSGDVMGGEQDVKFEGQQGNNQTQAQGQQGNNQTQSQGQQGNQTDDKGILEKLGEAVGIS